VRSSIRKIGNSQGILIPKPLISQLNLGTEVELKVEKEALIVRKAHKRRRQGWAAAAQRLAKAGENRLAWPSFSNLGDEKLRW
jgi:antitoxin MazE